MKKTMGLVYAVLLLLIISAAGCGNVISGGKNDDAAILPMALASPLSDSFLTQNGNIVILFNGSMNANTLSLSGHLGPEAGSTWSKTTNENDTLTIHPLSKWSEGDGLTLKVDCNDRAGKAIKQINLTYMIKVYLSEVEQFGTGFDDRACDVAIDSSGNIYITGNTKGDLVGNTMAGDSDIFLVKYNSTGIKQWTRQTGSSANDSASGMAIDSDGNIYITGRTDGSLDGNTNAGCSDIFLVKYNSSGEKLWTRQMGSTGSDWAIGVSTDSDGNIYITGQTDGDLVGNTNTVDSDIFLVKYNSSGVKQWTRQMGSSANDSPTEIVIDIFGFIYITGHTCGNMDGNTNAGDDDIFLVKYNLSGDKQWTRQIGTDKADYGNGVSVDSSGNIYVAGQTGGVLDGGTNAGESDIVLVKYNSDGDRQWTRQTGTAKADNASGVSVDDSGNIYVTGQTNGGLNGDANAGESDIVLVKYDPDGERQWSRQTGTVNADIANEVTTDSSGNIYVAGFSVNSSENEDILLAKYYSNTFESETFNFDLSLNLASSLTVTSKETLLLTKDLDASTNKITLQEGCGSYTLKVKKDGYDTFTQEYTMSELQSGTVTVNLAVRKSKIVYTAWLDGNADVYTIDTDGTNIKRLTTEAGRDYYPSWSPDGSKIVFMSNRACDSECDSAFDLYVMDADGENEKRLTSYGRGVFYPSWSPDGSKIAFSYSKGIYIMDADGNNQRLVAYDPNTCQDPSWSPDGSKIAFMLKSDIYTVDVDGNNLTNLTDPIYGSSGSGSHPSWSPDGSKIAFSYSSGNYEIVVMDADGQNFKNLSLNAAFDDYPSWSPDGSKIVFTSNRDGYYSLYFMDADGQNQTHAAAIGLFYPSWSPF